VIGGVAELDTRDLRTAGVLMLALGLTMPMLPGHHLGFPCPLRTLTGVPCPLCGMSTSVEDTVHAHLGAAAAANPAGILFVAIAAALVVIRPSRFAVSRLAAAGTMLAMWVFELHRFGFV
jgi:hypothetical protein